MSDLGEHYSDLKEHFQEKRWSRYEQAIEILNQRGIRFTEFANGHLRIGDFDLWATTGTYINRKTKRKGRGIHNLLRLIGS